MLSALAIATCTILTTPGIPLELVYMLKQKNILLVESETTDLTPVLNYQEIIQAEDAHPNCAALNVGSIASQVVFVSKGKKIARFTSKATAVTNKCDDLIEKLDFSLNDRLQKIAAKIAGSAKLGKFCLPVSSVASLPGSSEFIP